MAIGIGIPLKVTINGTIIGQVFNIVTWYTTDGAAFLTADPAQVGEAYWNDIKTVWRALMPDSSGMRTISVKVAEAGPTGAYGEYAIPPGEQIGLRSAASSDFNPPFLAAGIKQTVATRLTRPGQKRIPGSLEQDGGAGGWNSTYLGLVNNLAPKFAAPIVLGAPVATGGLEPIVTRLSADGSTVLASQPVVGFVTNPYQTTQNSRKVGRGI